MNTSTTIALTCRHSTPLGDVTLAERDGSLVGLWFVGQRYDLLHLGPHEEGKNPVLDAAGRWLDEYFAGRRPGTEGLPLRPNGTEFQRLVWDELLRIPYGETTTYGTIASRIAEATGRRTSARAVGSAVGRNPISIIVPCHRVVGSTGSLTGYAGGIDRKRALLAFEGVEL